MITGSVTSDGREALVQLDVRGPTGRTLHLDAVVDTGFTHWLSLRQPQIDDLKLAWHGRATANLADGTETTPDVYEAHVMWDGQSQHILVTAADTEPLVGMSLMKDYRLTIDIIPGGALLLEKLASPSPPLIDPDENS
jgi:clan AA aspartic protease